MKIGLKKKFTGIDLMYYSIYIMVLFWCLPITMCLPSMIRQGIQILALLMFLAGLGLHKKRIMLLQYLLVVLFVVVFAYGVWQGKKSIASCAVSVVSGWEFCCFGLILRNEKDNARKKRLLIFVIVLMVFTSITTIIGIQRYPLVVRELGRSNLSYNGLTGEDFALAKWEYRISNIAGWNQLYGIVFFVPCLIYLFKRSRLKVLLLLLAICELCIIRSQITFAILLSIFLIFFSAVTPDRAKKSTWIITIVLLLLGIVLIFNIDALLLLSVQYFKDQGFKMLSNKLYDLYMFMHGVSNGDARSRMNLYSQSIELFARYPFGGTFLHAGFRQYQFSQHSDFFDMLAFYGVFGSSFAVYMFIRYLIYIIRTVDKDKWLSFVLLVAFIGLYIFNPIWYSPQIFVGVFMLPGIITAITAAKEKNV